jgi:hypothetical protein
MMVVLLDAFLALALLAAQPATALALAADEPCPSNDPATIEQVCSLKARLECGADGLCTPVFYWVKKPDTSVRRFLRKGFNP